MLEKKIIDDFKKSINLVETKYFVLDLLTENYSVDNLVNEAKKNNLGAQLGFLCEVFYKGSNNFNVVGKKKLLQIYEQLENDSYSWQFLHPSLPDYGKAIIKESKKNTLNKKWKLYSNLSYSEANDWIDLYLKCHYLEKN